MIVEHYKSGKKGRLQITIDTGILEQFKLNHENVSAWIQKKMEENLLGIDEEAQAKSLVAIKRKELAEAENNLNFISQRRKNEEEIITNENDFHERKINKILDIIYNVVDNEGEISKQRIKTIAGIHEVSYEEIYNELPLDFIEEKVKNFDASICKTTY